MDFEKLDVYRVALEAVYQVNKIIEYSKRNRIVRDQILRSSTSVVLNIAEGTGKRSGADRRRYYEIARGSAMETSAALDILVVLNYTTEDRVASTKHLLRRVVAMLTRMTDVPNGVREEASEYQVNLQTD